MSASNKIIIYDDACPLCAAYTSAFVSTGLINPEGRKDFSHLDEELLPLLDTERCRQEIPVIDRQTRQVWYGIDGLLEILGHKYNWIKNTGHIRPVKWMLYKIYRLISYNRRVIVANAAPAGNFDCTPQFNTRYRTLLLALFLLVNTFLLLPVRDYVMQNSYFSASTAFSLQLVHFGLVALNIMLCFSLPRLTAWEYIGQISMLALCMLLLLLPLVLLNRLLPEMYDLNNLYLGALCCFFIYEYRRRMRFAGILRQYKWIVAIHVAAISGFLLFLSVKL
jgi:hypothetical protein